MGREVIRCEDRATGEVFTEAVYGERWLKAIYGNPLGRLAVWALLGRRFVSQWYGRRMASSKSAHLIPVFIDKYSVNMQDFLEPVDGFSSFNDFFCRELRAGARPIHDDRKSVVFPADGRHMAWPNAKEIEGVFVKGQRWFLTDLLGDRDLAHEFAGGSLLLSRLCPVDYHHFHFPIAGVATEVREIPGHLYSVNPIALRRDLSILWRNYRHLTLIETENWGRVVQLEIGATMVGSIQQEKPQGGTVLKGQRKGKFSFGGSSVILLFPPGRLQLDEDLLASTRRGIELYAHMGERFARLA